MTHAERNAFAERNMQIGNADLDYASRFMKCISDLDYIWGLMQRGNAFHIWTIYGDSCREEMHFRIWTIYHAGKCISSLMQRGNAFQTLDYIVQGNDSCREEMHFISRSGLYMGTHAESISWTIYGDSCRRKFQIWTIYGDSCREEMHFTLHESPYISGNAFPLCMQQIYMGTHAERKSFQTWTIYGDSCREEMHFRSGLYMGTHAERKCISDLDYIWGLMQRGNAFQIWTIYGDSCREEMHFRPGLYSDLKCTIYGDSCREEMHFRSGLYMTHAERKCISDLDYIWGLMQRGNAFQTWTIYGDSCREEMHFRSGLYMGTHAERKCISDLDYIWK